MGINVDEKDLTEMEETDQAAVDILEAKVHNLKIEDRTHGLYSFVNKNLSREYMWYSPKQSQESQEKMFTSSKTNSSMPYMILKLKKRIT